MGAYSSLPTQSSGDVSLHHDCESENYANSLHHDYESENYANYYLPTQSTEKSSGDVQLEYTENYDNYYLPTQTRRPAVTHTEIGRSVRVVVTSATIVTVQN